MEAQDPLADLADIHLPGAINAWPPAIGWWLLAALIIAGISYLVFLAIKKNIRLKKRSDALNALQQAYQRYSEQAAFDHTRNQAGLNFLNELNAILRRVALQLFPASASIASLHGNAWLAFLDQTDNSLEFSLGAGKSLGDGIYQAKFKADADALLKLAQRWIEQRYQEDSDKKISLPSTSSKRSSTPSNPSSKTEEVLS